MIDDKELLVRATKLWELWFKIAAALMVALILILFRVVEMATQLDAVMKQNAELRYNAELDRQHNRRADAKEEIGKEEDQER